MSQGDGQAAVDRSPSQLTLWLLEVAGDLPLGLAALLLAVVLLRWLLARHLFLIMQVSY